MYIVTLKGKGDKSQIIKKEIFRVIDFLIIIKFIFCHWPENSVCIDGRWLLKENKLLQTNLKG